MIQSNVPKEFTDENICLLYDAVTKAIEDTDITGKSNNQIFGEIYTRFRSYVVPEESLRFLSYGLKQLDRSYEGHAEFINKLINEVYEKRKRTEKANLEIAVVAMDDCLNRLKIVNEESVEVMLHLNKIEEGLDGDEESVEVMLHLNKIEEGLDGENNGR